MNELFTKSSTHPPGRLRLRKELVALRHAQHPGVVQVANFEDGQDRTRLELVRGGDTTIAESPPELPELALTFIAATAGTVGDLHTIGVAHRRLTGDHIIVTPEGHPLLCGFADATMPASEEDRNADQRSLGALVDLLAQSASSAGRHARAAKALRILAVEVAQGDGATTAAALASRAAKLAKRYPIASTASHPRRVASLGRRLAGRLNGSSPGSRWFKPIGAGLVAAVVILTVIVGLAVAPGSDGGDTNVLEAEGPVHTPSLGAVAQIGPVKIEEGNRELNSPAHEEAGTDETSMTPEVSTTGASSSPGDQPNVGTGEPAVRFSAGGATFAAGQVGDEVHVGDWKCTGEPAALLWRPDTGDVYVFAALPGPGAESTGTWATRAPGGSLAFPDPLDAACPSVIIRDADGSTRKVELS